MLDINTEMKILIINLQKASFKVIVKCVQSILTNALVACGINPKVHAFL